MAWLTLAFFSATASGQSPNTPGASAQLPASNAIAVAAALKALPAQHGLGDDARRQADDLLHQGLDDNTQADQLAQQLQSLRQLAEGAQANAQKLEDALARDDSGALSTWRATLPERGTAEQLDALLARERGALADAHDAADALAAEVHSQNTRPAQVRDELAAAHAALDAARVTSNDPAIAPTLATAQKLHAKAAQRLATIQIALLDTESRSYEPRMRLLSAQLRERQHAVNELGQHVAVLAALALNRTSADVADLQGRVAHERTELGGRSKVLGDAAETNVALCDQLAHAIARLSELDKQKQLLEVAQQDTDQALDNTEERIRIGGVTEAVGLILLAEQRKLQPLPLLQRQLAALQTELAKTRMDLIDLRERQAALNDIDGVVDQALARHADATANATSDLRSNLRQLLTTRAEIVPRLLAQQTRLADTLADAEQELGELTATTAKLGTLLDERLLWTPNYAPVDLAWLERLPAETLGFFGSRRWTHAVAGAAGAAIGRPLISCLCILGLIVLLSLRRRARSRLELIAARMRRIRTDRYLLTSEALGWTLLAAIPVPLALWLLGRLLQVAGTGSTGFAEDLGAALITLSLPAAVLSFTRALAMEQGLAHYHFRWPRPRREALYKMVPVAGLLILPIVFLIELMGRPGIDAPRDTLSRLLLAIALIGGGWFGWRLLAPGRLWTVRGSQLPEPLRMRQLVRVAFSTMCATLALLDLLGYSLTAEVFGTHLLKSLVAALGIATLHGLAVRWLVLGERRLALKRALDKLESADAESPRADGEALPEPPETEEITVANVSAQTRRLLRALTVLFSVSVLLWIWSDVTPALALLGNIAVWDSGQTIGGKEIVLHISLRDVLEAFVVLLLTWVGTRNLPGLLEVGVLRRFNIDAPTRYALTSVTRYLIVFAGTVFGLSMLGLRWSNLQWLAAGFSVGLGFGMQEIFANFISGLIVLFERPFRIGDIITIGTIEGTVARIRTRATTIIDWDNREVVVPNKSFITDRLVNWTLSDTTTRLVIKVGVAYRNDPVQAQRLLLGIAAAQPEVLKDPAPTCWMTGLGASTQDFELRVYVGEIGQRNPVRTELQMRIIEVFRENDMEIAFPQMDLWLRNEVKLQSPETPAQPAPRKT